MSNYSLINVSSNSKTGPIPVTVSNRKTCPPSCPLIKKGCYAEGYHTKYHWDKVTGGERGTNWDDFINSIKSLPKRVLWRHNISGDLVGSNDVIDAQALAQLTHANKNKLGFTYTHYPMNSDNNVQAVKTANNGGFTVNLSANNIEQAYYYKTLNFAPVVVVVIGDCDKVTFTPNNNKIVVCPAQTSDEVTCATCGLCQKKDRDYIIGFRVHGIYTKKAKLSLAI